MKTVLIISASDDIHSFAVAKEAENIGFKSQIFDSASFPRDWTIITQISGKSFDCFLTRVDGSCSINLQDVVGIWWRRPNRPDLTQLIPHPSYRHFTAAECEQALTGSLIQIENFINPIQSSRMASRKIDQLTIASRSGLRIPATLITTDPNEAERFYKTLKSECIYKTFTGCDFGFFETRILRNSDLDDLWRLRNCPTIFQEHIEGDYDLRVTIVGRRVFAAKLLFKEGRHPVDSRVDRVPVECTELPKPIVAQLLRVIDHFGLRYAAIDMRYSASDGYTFFEVNPEGQYLWIEVETGLKISSALAALLTLMQR